MHDFDPFERRLGTALRSDADESVGPFEAEAIARAAIDGNGGPTRLRRASSRPARRFGRGRGITLLAAAALLIVGGALAVGSGVVRMPSEVPPVPGPSFAVVATASPAATESQATIASASAISSPTPTPTATQTPSPTPVSLNLAWTKVPLDEKSPRVAWLGDRFVLVDTKSGAVRTSIDGATWQTLGPGDSDPGYADLLRGSFSSWQDDAIGWWNPQDHEGGDIAGAPPITARDVLRVVHPSAAPTSTTPFKGRIESIGIGPKGIVAEVHSDLDWDGWITKKLRSQDQ